MRNRRATGSRQRHKGARRSPASSAAPSNREIGEVVIERVSHDGRGIANWQGKTLFVDNALLGERVEARLIKERGRYAEAIAGAVIEAAPGRREPPCAHFEQCGGCQLQHMSPEQQLQVKQDALLEQMARWAGLRPARLLAPITSSSSGYRSRARLGVWYEKNGGVTLGFRRRQSRALVQVEHCLVLVPELNRLLVPLRQWLTGLAPSQSVSHIELIADSDGPAMVVRHLRPLREDGLSALAELAKQQGCRVWLQGEEGGGLRDLSGQNCDPRLHYGLENGRARLGFHPQDFIQVNAQVNEQMVSQVLALLQLKRDERVLDLFCGIGNFTLPLAYHCAEVVGVEGVASMVERGRKNAEQQGLANVRFVTADLSKIDARRLEQLSGKVSVAVLDPPRDGAKEIVPLLRQLSVQRLVYVSCNPATLARDAKLLADSGYSLQALGVLDMFPHTAHVESMALFVL